MALDPALDPGIAGFLQLIEASGYPPMSESTPEVARKAFRAMTCDLVTDETRVPVGSTEDVVADGVPCRVYRPDVAGPVPTLVYVHGGGFVIGDLETHDQTCRRLCSGADVVVLSVDYRLAPEAAYPAAVEDVLTAVRWAHAHLDELGGASVLGVGGDSAGGNLSAVASQALPDLVDAQVLIYPAVDMAGQHPSKEENGTGYFLDTPTMLWFGGHYLGSGADVTDVRHSPLLAESFEGLPPAVVVTAQFDPLRDEGEAYAAKLAEAGVAVDVHRYDGLIHGFIDMGPLSPAAADAVDDVAARAKALLHGLV